MTSGQKSSLVTESLVTGHSPSAILPSMKRTLPILLVVVLAGLATADHLFTDLLLPAPSEDEEIASVEEVVQEETTPPPPGTVRIARGPNVLSLLSRHGFATAGNTTDSLIGKIIDDDSESYTLIMDGDRAGMIAWVDSGKVKTYFLALKEALHSTFSPEIKDVFCEIKFFSKTQKITM